MSRKNLTWLSCILFSLLIASKYSTDTGFTSLIRFGETWQGKRVHALDKVSLPSVPSSSGYDGQFYAQIALDPLLRGHELKTALDTPAYRARRILTPGIAAVLGLGIPWLTLQAYALVNVVCWFLLAWRIQRAIPGDGLVPLARWTGCLFSMGVLESVRQSLVDLPALLLLVLAIENLSHPTRPWFWAGLSGLAKETSLLGALALPEWKPGKEFSLGRTMATLSIAALPLGAWSIYVNHQLGYTSGGLGNFTWPGAGMVGLIASCLKEISQGNLDGRFSFGMIAIVSLGIQGWTIWSKPNLDSAWWRLGAIYSVLLLFLSSWVWSGYWAAMRAVLPMTIAFNLLLPASRQFWPLWIVGNATALHAVWRFL